jgi:type II secretory pathway pseudopilin PulG
MFASAVFIVLAAMAAPPLLAGVEAARTRAAARFLAARMAMARMQAVAGGATVAIQFANDAGQVTFATYADGDEDGVRSADIASGTDPLILAPVRLSDLFPGVHIALTVEGAPHDPVQFGAGDLASFTASGTASSGTVYLRGRGTAQYAVRVLGATGRTRVLRYDAVRRDFVDTY